MAVEFKKCVRAGFTAHALAYIESFSSLTPLEWTALNCELLDLQLLPDSEIGLMMNRLREQRALAPVSHEDRFAFANIPMLCNYV